MNVEALPTTTASEAGVPSDVNGPAATASMQQLSPPVVNGGGGDDGCGAWTDLLQCCSCGEQLCDGPLLLACLHMSCRKCFDALANAAANSGGDCGAAATCKRVALCTACQRDSSGSATPAVLSERDADAPLDNFLVESVVRARQIRSGVAACGFCGDDDDDAAARGGGGGGCAGSGTSKRSGAAASHWCVDCVRYLCSRCYQLHSRFNEAHLVFSPNCGTGSASAQPLQPMLPVLCQPHGGAVCSLYCERCERLLCNECSKRCLADAHPIIRVGGERAAAVASRLAGELRSACGELEEKARLLAELTGSGGRDGRTSAASELEEARRRDLATQDENFRLALDMVDEAYREALATLDKLCEGADGAGTAASERKRAEMATKEEVTAEEVEEKDDGSRLLRSLEHALEFSAALLDTEGGGGGLGELLQLREPAERRLRALCDRADRFLASATVAVPKDPATDQVLQSEENKATPERRVVIEYHQPSNFGEVALDWIGVPRQHMAVGDDGVDHRTSQLSPSGADSASLAVQLRSTSASPASSANALAAVANAADDRPRVLRFGGVRRRLVVQLSRALGMSISADGHVFVAASAEGLIEYDAEIAGSGGELCRWLPPPELGDDVCAVECLEDGRVAVAVAAAACRSVDGAPPPSAALLLLGKVADGGSGCTPAASWREERRLILRCRALRVAAYGETLAVLGTSSHRSKDATDGTAKSASAAISAADDDESVGRELDLLCSFDGRTLLSRTLDFAAGAVALTARAVVLAASRGGVGIGDYSLQAYSYGWAPLWRRDCSYPVRDICPQPLGYVLYISCGSDHFAGSGGCAMKTVVAVSAEDGSYLCDLVHEPSAEVDGSAVDGAILAYDGLRAQLALMPRIVGCVESSPTVAIELRSATGFE